MFFTLPKKINKTVLSSVVFPWILLLAFLIILPLLNYGHVAYGLTVAGFDIEGMKVNKAREVLGHQIEKFQNQKMSFIYEQKKWELTPSELGINIEKEKILAKIENFGHQNNWLASTQDQFQSLFFGQELLLDFNFDAKKFNEAITLFVAIETPAQNAILEYDAKADDFKVLPAKEGLVVSRGQIIKDVLKNFAQPEQKIYLSLVKDIPLVDESAAESLLPQAKKLTESAPYFLQSESATWRIDKDDLGQWVLAIPNPQNPKQVQLSLNQNEIKDFLAPLAVSINREPLNAKLTWENNEIKFIILSQPGQKLNLEKSAQKISEDILAGSPEFSPANKNIYLVIDKLAAPINDQNIRDLGIITLLGKGESNFSGSPKNRQLNIKTGAQKLNGRLIKPGEEFSFAQAIGDIDEQNGWLPELVIKNNQTIPEYGGGICQISTTLFRAAVNSGLKITERHPHAYPVKYYNPPGFDATVYPPKPDLKFINNTPSNILLQDKIVGNKLIFEIYGTSDGREVKIKGPTITQKNPDGSLRTTLTQEIWRNGKLDQQNVFRSYYKSADLYPIVSPSPSPSPAATPIASPSPKPST
jgi:vancomycin resistance protein YoaR